MGTLLAKLWSGSSNKNALHNKPSITKSMVESDHLETEPSIQTESEKLPPCTCAELEVQEKLTPVIYTTVLETTVEVARENENIEVENSDSNVNGEDQGVFEIETNLWSPDVEDAITKIQAGIRGYLVRKQIRVLQQQTKDDKSSQLHEEEKYTENIIPPPPETYEPEQEKTRINGDDKSLDIPSQAAERLMDLKSSLEVSIDKDSSDEHLILHPTATLPPPLLEMLPKNVIEDHLSASNFESYEIEVEAATKIQAAYRGYKLRKTISHEPSPAPSPTNEPQNFFETQNPDDEIGVEISPSIQENIGANASEMEKEKEIIEKQIDELKESHDIVENSDNRENRIQLSVIPQENVENNFSSTQTCDISSKPIETSILPSPQIEETVEKCEEIEPQIKSEDLTSIPDICLTRNDEHSTPQEEKTLSSFAEPPVPRGSVDFDLLADMKPPRESEIVDKIESSIQNSDIETQKMNTGDELCLRPSKSRELDRKESADSDIMLLTDEFISKQGSSNLIECPSPPDFQFSDPSQDLKLFDSFKTGMENIPGMSSQLIDIKDETVPSSPFDQPTLGAPIQSSSSSSSGAGCNNDEMSAVLKKAEHLAPQVAMFSPDPILNPSSLDAGDDSELIALASNNSEDEELDSLSVAEPDFRPRSPNPYDGGKKRRRGKKAKTHLN
ncbi:uncharacterized protein LOC141857877 [Brevipalpus obovatus]|uniref:uncharacterized protein LOC141857877 n=1 Tax=Brevipalpus obovatus TaxID=246614 RepID=UPI003D9EA9E9